MSEKQYRLNKWGTRLLKNNKPLFDWFNDSDEVVDLLNSLNDENEQLKKELDQFYLLIGRGDWSGLVDLIKGERLNIDIKNEILFKSDLNAWIERKMDYYESMMEKTDGYNNVNAKGHLDMLIVLKEWIK